MDATDQEIILTIDGKATLHKAPIIINLAMNIIHSLSIKIYQTMHFLTIIIIINNKYHRHHTIQDSKPILTIIVFLLTTWDDRWRIPERRKCPTVAQCL